MSMKTFSYLIMAIICFSCSDFCDECVDGEFKVTTTGNIEITDIGWPNMILDHDEWLGIVIGVSTSVNSISAVFHHDDEKISEIDIFNQYVIPVTVIGPKTEDILYHIKIPMTEIIGNKEYPNGKVLCNIDIFSNQGNAKMEMQTYFYLCEDIDDDFYGVDCRTSSQVLGEEFIRGCP